MIRLLKKFRCLALALLLLSLWGCGGGLAPPPASIPAPVSQLLTVLPPNADGNSGVLGAAGSVQPGATVQATNLTQGGSFSALEPSPLDLFIRTAHAQTLVFETVADDQGAFAVDVPADSGDDIAIRQVVDGEASDFVIRPVP